MRFACFSDTHETRPSVDLSQLDVDYILHAGDMYDRLCMGMTPTSYDDIKEWAKYTDKLRIVRGNHDVLDPGDIFKHSELTGYIEELRQDLFLVGIGWKGERFYELPLEKDMAKVCDVLFNQAVYKIPSGAHTVILTHYPPYLPDVFPPKGGKRPAEGWFFNCVTKTVEAFRPIAVVQGHIHGLMGQLGTKDGTLFVFPGTRGGILTVDTQKACAEFKGFEHAEP